VVESICRGAASDRGDGVSLLEIENALVIYQVSEKLVFRFPCLRNRGF